MSKQIKLNNFYAMTGGWIVASADKKDLITKSIKNLIPQYALLQSETADSNIFEKVEPSFPLVITKTSSGLAFNATPTAIVPSRASNDGFICVTTDGKIKDQTGSTIVDFGNLYLETFNETADVQTYFDKIFTTASNQDYVYYSSFSGSGYGRISGFGAYGVEIPKTIVPFLNGVYITGGSNGDTLYKVDSSLTKSTVATLTNNTMRYGVNYNDRYLVYFTSLSQSAQPDGTDWFMVFHDGSTNGLFQYRTKINGQFIGHTQVGDIHYVFHEDGSDLICSYINAYSLTEVARIKGCKHSYSSTTSTGLNYRNKVAYSQGYFILPVKHLSDSCVLLWNPKSGESSFIYKNNTDYPRLVVANTYQSKPVFNAFIGTNTIARSLISTSTAQGDFEYKTNYLQFGERVKISRIDIILDPTFPSTDDKITFNCSYVDKLESPNYLTYQKADITTGYSDTDVQIDATRVIINNIGIVGTEFAFTLSGVVATTSWDLVIREIIVSYEDISQL